MLEKLLNTDEVAEILGVKKNTLQLYKFLCRNYQGDDRIFCFGFSRGAFTVRTLAGLIQHQGLVSFLSEEELDLFAAAAVVRLGTSVLRTSTAGVAAVAALLARTDRWA